MSKPVLQLENVLGCTVTNGNGIASHPISNEYAYVTGCVAILKNLDSKKNERKKSTRQTFLIDNQSVPKPLTCVSFSPSGAYLAVGERGHQPRVLVWDLARREVVARLTGHKYGVAAVCFSPDSKRIVSVGFQHDATVKVWDWHRSTCVASSSGTTKHKAASVVWMSSHQIVTVGRGFVCAWDVPQSGSIMEPVPCKLGDHSSENFVQAIVSADNKLFALTASSLLCSFSRKLTLAKWVNMQMESARTLCHQSNRLAVGGVDGTVRLFHAKTLEYILTLPKPHALGQEGSSNGANSGDDCSHPWTVALSMTPNRRYVTCVYGDRSLYTWDCKDVQKVLKVSSSLAHSGVVWGCEVAPKSNTDLPSGGFVTCGADGTIRSWTSRGVNKSILRQGELDAELAQPPDDVEQPCVKGTKGIRCITLSKDGAHCATGDRQGNVQVYRTEDWTCVSSQAAHNKEVLCIDYSSPSSSEDNVYLATSARDRLVHVFEATEHYKLCQTLDEHSGSVTAVRFGGNKLLSCSSDKSIVYRSVSTSAAVDENPVARQMQKSLPHGSLFDLAVDPLQKFVVALGQDKALNIYSIGSGKSVRSRTLSRADGDVQHASIDPAGVYVATSTAKKKIQLFDFFSGEKIADVVGHSEMITSVKITADARRVISTGADGCIFIWRIASSIVKEIKAVASTAQIPPVIPRLSQVTPKVQAIEQAQTNETSLPSWLRPEPAEAPQQGPKPGGVWGQRMNATNFSCFSEAGDDQIFFDLSEKRRLTLEPVAAATILTKDENEDDEEDEETENVAGAFVEISQFSFASFKTPAEANTRMSLSSAHFKKNGIVIEDFEDETEPEPFDEGAQEVDKSPIQVDGEIQAEAIQAEAIPVEEKAEDENIVVVDEAAAQEAIPSPSKSESNLQIEENSVIATDEGVDNIEAALIEQIDVIEPTEIHTEVDEAAETVKTPFTPPVFTESVSSPLNTPGKTDNQVDENNGVIPATTDESPVQKTETPENVRQHRADVERTRQRLIAMGVIKAPLGEVKENKKAVSKGKLPRRLEVYAQAAARLEKAAKDALEYTAEIESVLQKDPGNATALKLKQRFAKSFASLTVSAPGVVVEATPQDPDKTQEEDAETLLLKEFSKRLKDIIASK